MARRSPGDYRPILASVRQVAPFIDDLVLKEEYHDQVRLRALEIDRQFADLGLGITDASLVVLAARYDTRNILTLDHRHFRQLLALQGGHFRLLPTDS